MFGLGYKPTAKETANQTKREHVAEARAIQRELAPKEQAVRSLEAAIKIAATRGDRARVTKLAVQLQQARNDVAFFDRSMNNFHGIQRTTERAAMSARIHASTDKMTSTLEIVSKSLTPAKVAATQRKIDESKGRLEMVDELMNDLLEDVDPTETEDGVDDIVREAFAYAIPFVPGAQVPSAEPAAVASTSEEIDIFQQRMDALGKI